VDLPYIWAQSIYGEDREDIPADTPKPLAKNVATTNMVDTNIMYCSTTERALTSIWDLVNNSLADWFCKKHGMVDTSNYNSNFNTTCALRSKTE
jgi:hypothetical protein